MPPIVNSAGANPPLPQRRRDERRGGDARRARARRRHRGQRARPGHRRHRQLAARLPAPPGREHGRRLVAGRAVPSRRVRRPRRRSPGQLPPRAARALRRPHRHPDVPRARRRRRSRCGPPHRRRGARGAPRSTSPSSASARTRTSPSTIRRPTSRPPSPYLVVTLDEACRRQQVGEGWFPTLGDVPTRALSMSVRQILAAREILVMVPDQRKAAAVAAVLTGPITPDVPASILRTHASDDALSRRGIGVAGRSGRRWRRPAPA